MANFVHSKCEQLAPGTVLVLVNGTIMEPELEDPHIFPSMDKAVEWVEEQQESYPDLDYYVAPIVALHHTTAIRYVRNMKGKA